MRKTKTVKTNTLSDSELNKLSESRIKPLLNKSKNMINKINNDSCYDKKEKVISINNYKEKDFKELYFILIIIIILLIINLFLINFLL